MAGDGEPNIQITGGAQLERIVKALKNVDKDLRNELTRELRRTGKQLLPKVRQAIMAIPSEHDGTLRRQMAAAARVQLRSSGSQAGMTIRVDGRKMPAGKRSLPAYMEGTKPRWRHPVFGNSDNWVTQTKHPFFYKTVEPAGKEFHRSINAIAEKIAKKLR